MTVKQALESHQARAWHINTSDGSGEVITAHSCDINHGTLTFHNFTPADDDVVLVRAFSARRWLEVTLIDTPASPSVHLRSADSAVGVRT